MVSQRELDYVYMRMAYDAAALSRARRRKVGAVLVIPDEGRYEGVNGTPAGFDNDCEYSEDGTWITKPEVLHAESNAIAKAACSHASTKGSTLYCTLAPCFECAKLIIQCKIVRVVYSEHYPYPGHNGPMRTMGLSLLERAKIQVDHLPLTCHNDDKDLLPSDEGRSNMEEYKW